MEKNDSPAFKRLISNSLKQIAERLTQDLTNSERMEAELARQAKYSEVRADIWKAAAGERYAGFGLINHLLGIVGEAFDVCKVTYYELEPKNMAFKPVVHWMRPDCDPQEKVMIPLEIAHRYFEQECLELPNDLIADHQDAVVQLMNQIGGKSMLIVPFKDKVGEPTRFVSFCDQKTERKWNEFDCSILKELIQIISQQIKVYNKNMTLEANMRKFQAYVENSKNVIYTISSDGIVTYISPTWTETLGHEPEEVVGQPFTLFVHPNDIPTSWQTLNTVLSTDSKQTGGTFRIKRKDGIWRWYATSSTSFKDKFDRNLSLLGVAYDITDRIENEQLLIQERQRFFGLIENIPAIVMEISDKGIINFVNQRVKSEAGFTVSDLIGKHYLEAGLIMPEYHNKLLDSFDRLKSGGEVKGLEIVILSKQESEMYFELNAILLKNRVLAVIANVTEVKLASQKLKRAYDELELIIQRRTQQLQLTNQELNQEITERNKIADELRESQQMLNLVVNTIPHSIFWKDRDSVYQGCNRNFAKASGVTSPEEIIGKTDYDLAWTKTQADSHISFDQKVMDADKPEYHIVEQQLQASGETAWITTNKIPLHGTDGAVIGILGTFEDISEEVEARKQEKIREQQLIQADKMISLGILVSGIAHEINNPNQFIMSHISPLERVCQDAMPILEKYQAEYGDFRLAGMNFTQMKQKLPNIFDNLMSGSQRIKNIVQELREYIRGEPSEHIESIQFNGVVESALTLLENLIKKSTSSFQVEYGENLPFIKGHYQRLEQVIINLVQNACQALTNIEESILIRTEFNKHDNAIVFSVRDEGIGIPSDQLERVTDLFYTTKRDIGGTGLGLAISSKIILEHEGKMTFKPGEKKGTIATVSLPLKKEQPTKAQIPKLSEKLFSKT